MGARGAKRGKRWPALFLIVFFIFFGKSVFAALKSPAQNIYLAPPPLSLEPKLATTTTDQATTTEANFNNVNEPNEPLNEQSAPATTGAPAVETDDKSAAEIEPAAVKNGAKIAGEKSNGNSLTAFVKNALKEIYGRILNFFNAIGRIFSRGSSPASAPRSEPLRVDFSGYYRGAPEDFWPNRDQPIIGEVWLYWLDTDGNICRGQAGVDSQSGPSRIIVNDSALYVEVGSAAAAGRVVSQDEVNRWRSAAGYSLVGVSNGSYLVQFKPLSWRAGNTGQAINNSIGAGASQPQNFSLTAERMSPAPLEPTILFNEALRNCFGLEGLEVPSRDAPGMETTGEPDKCQARGSFSAGALIRACLDGRLEGGLRSGYFRVR